MEDLEPQSSLNPSIVYSTTWRPFPEDGKERYIFHFPPRYHHVLQNGFCTWFCNRQTINSFAIESWCDIIWEMMPEGEITSLKVSILYLQT
jgi:hypothetical protein